VGARYLDIKKEQPHLPVLVREAEGVQARCYARFQGGVERRERLDGLTPEQVEQRVRSLVQSS